MDPLSIDQLRARLLQRQQALRDEVREGEHALDPATATGRADLAERRAGQEVIQAGVERDLRELRDIDLALQRLDSGHFAECVECGAAIAPQRLAAEPSATRCISCQREHELHHPS
jgi:DnaK suppressor protein